MKVWLCTYAKLAPQTLHLLLQNLLMWVYVRIRGNVSRQIIFRRLFAPIFSIPVDMTVISLFYQEPRATILQARFENLFGNISQYFYSKYFSHQVFLAARCTKSPDEKESAWRRHLTRLRRRGRKTIWKRRWTRFAQGRPRCRKQPPNSVYRLVRCTADVSERRSNFHAVILRRGLKTL